MRFAYGATVSAHQVEGYNIHNDWWSAELRKPAEFQSGRAADHWNAYKDDIALVHDLGHTAQYVSIEWSRIEPSPGVWNYAALAHYENVLSEYRRYGIHVYVGLHHVTLPVWLSRMGGWRHAHAPELFARYARKVAQHMSGLVDGWITIYEPVVYALRTHWYEAWPPYDHNVLLTEACMRNMASGHMKAYDAIHRVSSAVPVGIVQRIHPHPGGKRIADRCTEWLIRYRFLNMIRSRQDYIGVSHDGETAYCKELDRVLRSLHASYNIPLFVVGGGISDVSDWVRIGRMRSQMRAIEEVQADGVYVQGYFHNSFLDGFSWDKGYGKQRGLVEVDSRTLRRKARTSAYALKEIIDRATR